VNDKKIDFSSDYIAPATFRNLQKCFLTCPNFYRGLKCLVVPMLANMMESDKKKRWTFEIFFGEVFKIKDMLPVRLYDCSVGSNLNLCSALLYFPVMNKYVLFLRVL
jgi:hypothetical protein